MRVKVKCPECDSESMSLSSNDRIYPHSELFECDGCLAIEYIPKNSAFGTQTQRIQETIMKRKLHEKAQEIDLLDIDEFFETKVKGGKSGST